MSVRKLLDSKMFGVTLLVCVLGFGLNMFHYVIWHAPSPATHGDFGDARLIHIYLEHGFSSLFEGWPSSITSTPWAYFPFPNVLFFADSMLGAQITYVPLRLFGFAPFNAYQYWHVANSILNFLCMSLFLRIALRANWLGVAAGAYLFAFNMPRNVGLNHPQMLPHFWTPLAALFFICYLRASYKWQRLLLLMLCGIAVTMQIWAGFYQGWYLVFAALVAAIYWSWNKDRRCALLDLVKRDRIAIITTAIVAAAMLVPFVIGHGTVQKMVGGRGWHEISSSLPQITSYFIVPVSSWAYSGLLSWVWAYVKPWQASEGQMFSGFAAFASPLVIWLLRHKNPEDRVLHSPLISSVLAVYALIFVLSFASRTGYSLWWLVYHLVPGASAVRAMGRIAMFQAFLTGTLLAGIITWVGAKKPTAFLVGVGILLLVIAENQMKNTHAFAERDSQARIAAVVAKLTDRVTPCRSFFAIQPGGFGPFSNLDAMWASMQTRVPTMNGYIGNTPPGMTLDPRGADPAAIAAWLAHNGMAYDAERDCLFSY